ncbi:hypothetical protein WA026_007269 [Henosepilachna vigintioctopunctata]|uniref:C2H2-type domain-containing protein n=1 Tax=Henosepilachna vigintioctopunctata TaxID=420089 RepID=A0AAW1UVD2_9CUCU
MSSKTSKKLKKPLDLPLGKASLQKEVDLSHVQLPIETSVFGFKQVLSLFETATSEVKHYLTFECDLMYECRLCRTIFRSLANFILHKRKYCREKYTPVQDPAEKYRETNGIIIIQKDIEKANEIIFENNDSKNISGHNLNPIIEKLMKKQEHEKFVENLINENLSDNTKRNTRKSVENKNNILLEKIDTSDVAVFQTAAFSSKLGDTELMKTEVMEIHSIFDKDEAVIGSDGKVISFETSRRDEKCLSKYTLTCTECKEKFSTKKTLACHVKYKHNKSRLVYPCPLCKDTLANAWSVYRHLLKVHRKTPTQIRKYRNIIHNSATCKKIEDLTTKVRKETKEVTHKNDEENEWLDNIEGDNDLQMCGGCGKRFERKAALISHSVMCTKRIALCNSIKENSGRKKETDDWDNKSRETTFKTQAIGSAKRKPENLITYKPKTENESADRITENEQKKITTKEDISVKVQFGEQISDDTVTITSDNNKFNNSLGLNSVIHISEKAVEQTSAEDQLCHSGQAESPSTDSEESFSSKLSERSVSPCKGFENNQSLKFPNISRNLMNNTNSETDCKSNVIDICVNNNIPDENIEVIMTDEHYCPSVNYKSVIKNIIGDSDNKLTVNNVIDTKEITDFRESAVNASKFSRSRSIRESNNTDISTGKNVNTFSKSINVTKNHSADIIGTYKTKRKRDDQAKSEGEIKKLAMVPNDIDPSLTEIADEVFISRITPYADMPNLCCSLCSSQFSSLSHLLLHMSIHFSWYRYQCSKCSFMSYNKCDCESHVHKEHQIPFSQMQSTVLPIPTWKTATISDNVTDLQHTAQHKKSVYPKEDCIKTLNVEQNKIDLKFEPVKYGKANGKQNSTTTIVGYIDLTNEKDDKVQELTNANGDDSIIMEIDRDDNDSNSPIKSCGVSTSQNLYQISPDMSKQAILEVILGDEYKKNKYENINTSAPKTEYVRAPRNRVKSIKTSQKDFIYEMNIVRNKPLK